MIWQRINPTDEFIEDPGLDKDEVEGLIRAVEYEKTTLKGTVDFNWLPPPYLKMSCPMHNGTLHEYDRYLRKKLERYLRFSILNIFPFSLPAV